MIASFPDKLPALTATAPHIIIGSGIAGLYMALELSRSGQEVILLTKSDLLESNSSYAQGGIAAAMEPYDSPELHYQDTMMAGAGLCDSEAVISLVHDGPDRVRDLIELGVPFNRDSEGKISLTREAAHSRRRILHANGDATGRGITQTLISKVRQAGVKIFENRFALALVTVNTPTQTQRCCGVITIYQGRLELFLSSSVALASGGLGQVFAKTTNPPIATGDGMALAFNAGSRLRDMEFIQFHPTALHLPPAPPFLISETVRGEGAVLLNSAGERFMPDYHPLAELAPRDVVARSIFAELQKRGETSVYLDLSKLQPEAIRGRFPNIYETCLRYGLDISTNPIPVAPAAHYMMGGIMTNLSGQTDILGLYAAGETASTGVHGANRLASNSLLEGLVFGKRCVEHMLQATVDIPMETADLKVHYPEIITDYSNLNSDYRLLHELTNNYLGIVREKTGLEKALQILNNPTQTPKLFDTDPVYFELQNMYLLAKLMFQAALTRTESRGGHFRLDYPTPENSWRKHITFHQSQMEVTE